jgi:transcriptional regulator with XRE-family HTH domain
MRQIQTLSDSLQQQNQTPSDFFRRTDVLSDRLGLKLSEIAKLVGISKAMLFSYRSGKNRITPKVWLKLERAERTAGIETEKEAEEAGNAESDGNPKEFPSVVREDLAIYRVGGAAVPKAETAEQRLSRMEDALMEMADRMEELAREIRTARNES